MIQQSQRRFQGSAFKFDGDLLSNVKAILPEIFSWQSDDEGLFCRQAVNKGEVLLEWDKGKGEAPAPMLKDVYASERRKAKTLNFSIAYGKTSHGLAKDWGVSSQVRLSSHPHSLPSSLPHSLTSH